MTLLLDLSDLEREVGGEVDFRITGGLPEDADVNGARFGPVTVKGRALWTGRTVLVRAVASTEAVLTCSRCLGEFRTGLSAEFVQEYRPEAETCPSGGGGDLRQHPQRQGCRPEEDASSAGHGEVRGDGGEVPEEPLPFVGQVIDLTAPAWGALVLELPMKPVCSERCRGLCPVCGTDLNRESCTCRVEEVDPRLSPLKKLLEKAKERSD
ncbi:MAG TPA: hypothetical protein DGR79_05190 [Clostridiales bacterium]|nr:hypothetical protein [Clostridiales bacterium]